MAKATLPKVSREAFQATSDFYLWPPQAAGPFYKPKICSVGTFHATLFEHTLDVTAFNPIFRIERLLYSRNGLLFMGLSLFELAQVMDKGLQVFLRKCVDTAVQIFSGLYVLLRATFIFRSSSRSPLFCCQKGLSPSGKGPFLKSTNQPRRFYDCAEDFRWWRRGESNPRPTWADRGGATGLVFF